MYAFTATVSPEDFVSSGHGNNWWCAACGGQYKWRNPTRILVMQDSTDRREATVFRAHVAPHEVCDKLIKALEHLANQYQDGVRVLVKGLHERSRLKMMEEMRKFITMDNHRRMAIRRKRRNRVRS